MISNSPLLKVEGLSVTFTSASLPFRQPTVFHAVRDVGFQLASGQTLAIVGESGSGKSTLVRAVLRLIKAQAGSIVFNGQSVLDLSAVETRRLRRRIQMIFQDPIASLSPRRTVFQIIEEPLLVHFPGLLTRERQDKVRHFMDLMRLPLSAQNRYPHEFSGGQAQRIGIARALISEPDLLIADEPVSALDVSIQAEVLDLLAELKQTHGLTMLFISHDLSVVYQVSDRVLVLHKGQIKEQGSAEQVFKAPTDAYTRRLLSAIPRLEF